MNKKIGCGEFIFRGDSETLGERWTDSLDRFDIYVEADGLTYENKIKSQFPFLIGIEAYAIYKRKRKPDNSDTLKEIHRRATNG